MSFQVYESLREDIIIENFKNITLFNIYKNFMLDYTVLKSFCTLKANIYCVS